MLQLFLARVIFGILLPSFAFHYDYPGGINDMYNKVNVELSQPYITEQITVRLSDSFTADNEAAYDFVNAQLASATEYDKITIVVENNKGGDASMLDKAYRAIQNTKAEVVLTVKHFGYSCGTYILGQGNYLLLPYDTTILFHMGSVAGIPMSVDVPDGWPADKADVWARLVQLPIDLMEPYKNWISKDDYTMFLHGKNMFYSGREICLGLTGGNAPVLYQVDNGCVIKGFKYSSPSFFEKLAMMKFGGY